MSGSRKAKLGSSLDDLLKETGDYVVVRKAAMKRVLVWQMEQARVAQGLTKAELAERVGTSRSQLNRLLDPDNDDVTISALRRVASALAGDVQLSFTVRTKTKSTPARAAVACKVGKGEQGSARTVKTTVPKFAGAGLSQKRSPRKKPALLVRKTQKSSDVA